MNINDVERTDKEEVKDYLQAIFEKQHALAIKYQPIEARSGLLQTTDFPVDINSPAGQARLKDLAWRTVEELGEATECMEENEEHFREELIDALHFATELVLSTGLTYGNFISLEEMMEREKVSEDLIGHLWRFTENLGIAMNCLKNKPWKQTHMETDIPYFTSRIMKMYVSLIDVLHVAGMSAEDVYTYYFKKNQVNQFRQRSMY